MARNKEIKQAWEEEQIRVYDMRRGEIFKLEDIHLIPRRDGDTPKPRGGVRGVIPDKMSY